jgi:hypothetical protein
MDPCMFVKQVEDRVFILLLYVDDILAIVDEAVVKILKNHLTTKYGTIQFKVGEKQLYLGMETEITSVGTVIGMCMYIWQLLDEAEE